MAWWDAVRRLSDVVTVYRERYQARRELSRLDARTLRDVGLDLAEVRREMGKPFWRG